MRMMCWWHTASCTDLFYFYCISSLMFSLSSIICLNLVGEQKTLVSGCSYTFSYRFPNHVCSTTYPLTLTTSIFLHRIVFTEISFCTKTFFFKHSCILYPLQVLNSYCLCNFVLLGCFRFLFCSLFLLLLYTFMLFQNYCLIETYLVLCICRCMCAYLSTLSAHSRFQFLIHPFVFTLLLIWWWWIGGQVV